MGRSGNGEGGQNGRLRSWKEIAAFFEADERTVKRWEAKRGMPVQRVPGARGTVYADTAELELWLKASDSDRPIEPPPLDPAPSLTSVSSSRRPILAPLALLLLVGGGAAALAVYQPRLSLGTAASAHRPPQEAVDLHLAGMYHWERRTAASLNHAVGLFRQAIARDPEYAEPYAGLANCYLLLREYAGMADDIAYPQALTSAERALALNPDLAEGHAALAFIAFYWLRDFPAAERSFQRAISLAPGSARARHWYATALLHMGEFPRALEQIGAAQRLEPQSRSILADRALILFYAGRPDEAVAQLRQMAAAEPDFLSPHNYLALIHLHRGDHASWIAEEIHSAGAVGDQPRLAALEAARRAGEQGGSRAMFTELLERQRSLHREGRETHYALAATHAMLGDRDAALEQLRTSLGVREPKILELRIDPAFLSLREEAEFRRLAAQIGVPTAT
jgi:tetratricopeptide (TPR) repeat protein